MIGDGKFSEEIADVLRITVATVASHRKQLRQKLGVHSTAELVSYAAQKFHKSND